MGGQRHALDVLALGKKPVTNYTDAARAPGTVLLKIHHVFDVIILCIYIRYL